MNVAFFTDHKFVVLNQEVFTTGSLNKLIWDRYLSKDVSKLMVYGRQSFIDKPFAISSHSSSKVHFNFLQTYSNFSSILKSDKHVFRDLLANVDLAICRFPGEIPNRAADAAKELGVPVFAEVVGCVRDGLFFNGSMQAKVYSGLAHLRMKSAVKSSSFANYVTQNFLQSRYPSKGSMSAISDVNLPELDQAVLNTRIERIFKARCNQPLVIGLIGSMQTTYKGIHDAIYMLKSLIDRGMKVVLRVLGPGDSRVYEMLASSLGIESFVFFDGTLPGGSLVFDWLDHLDLYIQPSYTEGLPRALLEAMSRGLPCVTSSAGGMPEIVDSNYLFSPGDINSFSSAVRQLLLTPSALSFQAKCNFKTSADYTLETLNAARTAFYDSILSSVSLGS